MTRKDVAIALFALFLGSLNMIVQKIAVDHLSIYVLSFLRVALVFPLVFLYPKPQKSFWKYLLCGFFWSSLYLVLLGFGIKTNSGAGITAIFLQMQVFFIIICCFMISGEKPAWFQVMGIVISSVGVYLLSTSSSASPLHISALFLLGACFSFGLGVALSKKYKIGGSMSDITWLSMGGALPLLFACFIFEGPMTTFDNIINMSLIAFSCIIFTVIVATVWVTYLWLSLFQRAPSSSVASFMLLFPIFTYVLSNLITGEQLSWVQMLASIIIILGVMFAQGLHQRIPQLMNWIKKRYVYD